MLKPLFILGVGLFWNHLIIHAQNTGIYEAGIILDGITYSEPGNSLNNRLIVKTSGQKLNLTSVFLKTFKNISIGNICKGYLFYRIYPDNGVAPSYKRLDCSLYSNINGNQPDFQNQIWQNNSVNTDLIRNLVPGNYFLELYYAAGGSNNSSACNDTIYLNGAATIKATIKINSLFNIRFTGFLSSSNNEKVFLSWQIEQVTSDLQYFVLEKSHNGVAWKIIDTLFPSGTQYFYTDKSPFVGVNFYRVRANGAGKTSYSIVRRVYVGIVENIVTIYPNPVYRNLRFQMTAIIKGRYDVVVYNSDGTRIAGLTIEHDGNDHYVTIPLPASTNKGVYWLVLYSKAEFYKRSFLIE